MDNSIKVDNKKIVIPNTADKPVVAAPLVKKKTATKSLSPMVASMISVYRSICADEQIFGEVCIPTKESYASVVESLNQLENKGGVYTSAAVIALSLPPIKAKKFTIMDPATAAFEHIQTVVPVPGFRTDWDFLCRYGRTGFVFSQKAVKEQNEELGVARVYTDGSKFIKTGDTVLVAASRIWGKTKEDAGNRLLLKFPIIVSKRGGDSYFVINKRSLDLFNGYKIVTSPSLIKEGYDAYIQVEAGPEEQEVHYLI